MSSAPKTKDVSQKAVDKLTERIVKNGNGITVDKARQIARESADRINHQRRK